MAGDEERELVYFDTIITASFDPAAQVVRGCFGRFEPSEQKEPTRVQAFIIPAYHFMQQAAFFEAVAKDIARRDFRLLQRYDEMRSFFQKVSP